MEPLLARRSVFRLGFVFVSGLACASVRAAPAAADIEGKARKLEQRLHAPCCRDRMLEDHESEPAHQMKAEIRSRLREGQTELEIERAFRERHGDDIVSVPLDHDPRTALSSALAVLLAGSAGLLLVLGRRWRIRSLRAAALAPGSDASAHDRDEALDAQLDRELHKLDE